MIHLLVRQHRRLEELELKLFTTCSCAWVLSAPLAELIERDFVLIIVKI
jgi:hypothetical protein